MPALYDNESLLQVLFVTVVLGCGCAWLAGRAVAQTWRPAATAFAAMLLLGLAVRFFHFALFGEELFRPLTYAVETAGLIAVALAGWRLTRARQMTRQYYWLYEPSGPFGWRLRQDAAGQAGAGGKIAGDSG
jgi:hypothetical protein